MPVAIDFDIIQENNNNMLHCPKCNQDKEETDFFKNRSRKNGYNGYCKVCSKQSVEIMKEKYKKAFVPLKELKCSKCGILKPINNNFSKHCKEKNGYFPVCYACQKLTGKKPEIVAKQWKSFSERILIPRHEENIERIFNILGNTCKDCGRLATIKTFIAFDLHHLNKSEKKISLNAAKLSHKWTEETEIEVKKCILLCACCHRLRHKKTYE